MNTVSYRGNSEYSSAGPVVHRIRRAGDYSRRCPERVLSDVNPGFCGFSRILAAALAIRGPARKSRIQHYANRLVKYIIGYYGDAVTKNIKKKNDVENNRIIQGKKRKSPVNG